MPEEHSLSRSEWMKRIHRGARFGLAIEIAVVLAALCAMWIGSAHSPFDARAATSLPFLTIAILAGVVLGAAILIVLLALPIAIWLLTTPPGSGDWRWPFLRWANFLGFVVPILYAATFVALHGWQAPAPTEPQWSKALSIAAAPLGPLTFALLLQTLGQNRTAHLAMALAGFAVSFQGVTTFQSLPSTVAPAGSFAQRILEIYLLWKILASRESTTGSGPDLLNPIQRDSPLGNLPAPSQ
jgi:hypothetical protein